MLGSYCFCMGTMIRGCVLLLELTTEAEVHTPSLPKEGTPGKSIHGFWFEHDVCIGMDLCMH